MQEKTNPQVKLVNVSQVKKLAKKHNRRVSKDFMNMLNEHVINKVVLACETHNGGKRTLDASVAAVLKIGVIVR